MDNGITVLGQVIKAQTLRKVVVWFGVIGVLLCSIVGSGILSMQEGARPLETRQPPASTGVAILPSHTPTTVPLPTMTPTFAATWTPSPTAAGAATPTVTTTSTTEPTSTLAATAPATPTSAPTAVLLPPTPDCVIPAEWQPYIVQPGDTLTGLAWRTGTTVAAIMQANCLSNTTIYSGRRLYLPAPPVVPTPPPTRCVPNPPVGWVAYVVQPGDTLIGLAIRHGTSLAMIQQVNCLPDTTLYAHQHIYLPYIPPTLVPTLTPVPTWTATTTPALTLTPTLTVVPTTTPVATATITVPTSTVEPTTTIAPSVTVVPTETATIVPSPTVIPTQTSDLTPVPTETTQAPTATPTTEPPTVTATPTQPSTATAAPTETPVPTLTPVPTATDVPTATLVPAATPTLTPTRGLVGITPPPLTVTPTATTGV